VPLDVLAIDVEVRISDRPPVNVDPEKEPARYQAEMAQAKHLRRGQPIEGLYRVESDGKVDLGFEYGQVSVSTLTVLEAKAAIRAHLEQAFKIGFDIRVQLAESQAQQQIRGEHLVRPDGKITLGSYGSVYVTGMTLEKAKTAIQDFLATKFLEPDIALDVSGYNSMVYYVIFDLDGSGQAVTRMPFTGNETVLDAIGELKGLPAGSDRFNIWVARPASPEHASDQVLPVNWQAISRKGATATNYQLMPGDRLYVAVDPLVAADGVLAKMIAPVERILGVILLGNTTYFNLRGRSNFGGGGF
jgi:polysaccharide export outer membrane protein